ncbi:MAG: DUF309 domain-containing protein [Terriglobia bacterium]
MPPGKPSRLTRTRFSGIFDPVVDAERKRETFARGIACFNRRQFFECHEVLEEIWLAEVPEEKPFYQGLIQVAAAFHHYQKGNLAGARSLLRQGLAKLATCPADSHGIDLAGLRSALAGWLEPLDRAERPEGLALPQIGPAR